MFIEEIEIHQTLCPKMNPVSMWIWSKVIFFTEKPWFLAQKTPGILLVHVPLHQVDESAHRPQLRWSCKPLATHWPKPSQPRRPWSPGVKPMAFGCGCCRHALGERMWSMCFFGEVLEMGLGIPCFWFTWFTFRIWQLGILLGTSSTSSHWSSCGSEINHDQHVHWRLLMKLIHDQPHIFLMFGCGKPLELDGLDARPGFRICWSPLNSVPNVSHATGWRYVCLFVGYIMVHPYPPLNLLFLSTCHVSSHSHVCLSSCFRLSDFLCPNPPIQRGFHRIGEEP